MNKMLKGIGFTLWNVLIIGAHVVFAVDAADKVIHIDDYIK